MRSIRHLLTLCILFLITINGFGQAELENEIFSGMIKGYFYHKPNDTVFGRKGNIEKIHKYYVHDLKIIIETYTHNLGSKADSMGMFKHQGLTLLDSTMYLDFIEKNKTTILVDSISGFEGKIAYLSKIEVKKIFENEKDRWNNYHKILGYSNLVSFSRPGINKEKNRAFIYFEYANDGLAGIGMYFIMEKINGIWVIKESMGSWIS